MKKLNLELEWVFVPKISTKVGDTEYTMQRMPPQADGGDWFWLMIAPKGEYAEIVHVINTEDTLTIYAETYTLVLAKPDNNPHYVPVMTIIDAIKEGPDND